VQANVSMFVKHNLTKGWLVLSFTLFLLNKMEGEMMVHHPGQFSFPKVCVFVSSSF